MLLVSESEGVYQIVVSRREVEAMSVVRVLETAGIGSTEVAQVQEPAISRREASTSTTIQDA